MFLIFSPENVKGRWKDVREGGREGGKRLSQSLPGSTALAEAGRSPDPGRFEDWMLYGLSMCLEG